MTTRVQNIGGITVNWNRDIPTAPLITDVTLFKDYNNVQYLGSGGFEMVLKLELADVSKSSVIYGSGVTTVAVRYECLTKGITTPPHKAMLALILSNHRRLRLNPYVPLIYKCYLAMPTIGNGAFLNGLFSQLAGSKLAQEWMKMMREKREVDSNTWWLITEMEYLPGGSLLDHIRLGDVVSPAFATGYNLKCAFLQLCWSLYQIHSVAELHHLDVKASNILLRRAVTAAGRNLCLDPATIFRSDVGGSDTANQWDYLINDFDMATDPDVRAKIANAGVLHDFGFESHFDCPISLLAIDVKSIHYRGAHTDVWRLGHLFLVMTLNGFEWQGETFRGSSLLTVLYQFVSYAFVSFVKELIVDDLKARPAAAYGQGDIDAVILWCAMQNAIGNGYLPEKQPGYIYWPGPLHEVMARPDIRTHIETIGHTRADVPGQIWDTQMLPGNVFSEMVNYVRSRVGEDGLRFIRRHLQWMPEQRRVTPLDHEERGQFLRQSLLGPFFEEERLPVRENWGFCSRQKKATATQKQFSVTRMLLGKSVHTTGDHCVLVYTKTNKAVITSRITGQPACACIHDKDTLVQKLSTRKQPTDHGCPNCSVTN